MSRTDRLWLALVVLAVVGVDLWLVQSAYRTSVWVGREPLPTFLAGDGPYYRATLLSLIQDRDLDIRNQFAAASYAVDSHASLGAGGQWYPKPPILMSLLSIPFFLVAGDLGLLGFNLTQLALLAAIMWLLARSQASAIAASVATLVFMLGSMLRPAAYNWSPDVLSTVLTLAALLALLHGRVTSSAVLASLAVWAKVTNLVVVLPLAAYALWVTAPQARARFISALALGFAGIGLWNWALFGSPLITSYDRVIAGIAGSQAVIEPSHRTFFDVGLVRGAWTQLVDDRNGLLVSAPPILMGILGLVPLYRRNAPLTALIATMMAALILVFAPYRLWDQSNFGHRFLLTVVALGAVPFAALLDSLRRPDPAIDAEPK